MRDHPSRRVPIALVLALSAAIALALAPAAGAQPVACITANNGTGTATLPAANCPYLSPSQVHLILNGLPPGTTLQLKAAHSRFFCNGRPGPCTIRKTAAGGTKTTTAGEIERFSSTVTLTITGTGALAGFSRTLSLPADVETETGPRTLGAAVQTFDNQMNRLAGAITGDSDFASLRIVAGEDHGLPSRGRTTLTRLTDGRFRVDSYFDVGYRIDFVGTGRLEGFGGSTEGTVRMVAQGQ